MDGFTLVADPTRRAILDRLRQDETDVTGLARLLGLSQPLVSKHLKLLRESGAVTVRAQGKRRVYRLDADPLPDVLAWVTPYYQRWSASLDRLAAALDHPEEKP